MQPEIQMIFEVIMATLGFILVYLFNKMTQDLSKLTTSVEQLNIKIAVICERVESHDSRIKNIEEKVITWNK